jgi:hypothetical protein
MPPLPYYLIPLLLSSGGLAVNVRGYWTDNCRSIGGTNGQCTNLPEHTCCLFWPEPATLPPGVFSGNTRSVEWTRFGECQLLKWNEPNSGNGGRPGTSEYNCGGRIRDSYVSGHSRVNARHCMSSTHDLPPRGGRHDGASWYVLSIFSSNVMGEKPSVSQASKNYISFTDIRCVP